MSIMASQITSNLLFVQQFVQTYNKKDMRIPQSWPFNSPHEGKHYSDVIMGIVASQVTSISVVCLTVCSSTDQRKHQSSTSLTFVRGIHHWLVNSPQKGSVMPKMFPFDDVVMWSRKHLSWRHVQEKLYIPAIRTIDNGLATKQLVTQTHFFLYSGKEHWWIDGSLEEV